MIVSNNEITLKPIEQVVQATISDHVLMLFVLKFFKE